MRGREFFNGEEEEEEEWRKCRKSEELIQGAGTLSCSRVRQRL